jgi:hypothetical protein
VLIQGQFLRGIRSIFMNYRSKHMKLFIGDLSAEGGRKDV